MTKTPYTLNIRGIESVFSRKDRAVKAGQDSNETFTVTNPAGKVVHVHVKDELLGLDTIHTVKEEAPAKAAKVCKKDASHGEHRVTKSGSYCYACDRIVAEAQKAARQAAK